MESTSTSADAGFVRADEPERRCFKEVTEAPDSGEQLSLQSSAAVDAYDDSLGESLSVDLPFSHVGRAPGWQYRMFLVRRKSTFSLQRLLDGLDDRRTFLKQRPTLSWTALIGSAASQSSQRPF